ncbi:hypothetical protein PVAP13_2NG315700 [Panicum virgatum]|uniref:Uncharacterized protein n=1 Tax=Panicum virgatum TaxID=38727 RepID=A0A8T0VRA4_PANVG|nr:hypothetical protein PVAP13_2NG315700 [Panicum virgatum]
MQRSPSLWIHAGMIPSHPIFFLQVKKKAGYRSERHGPHLETSWEFGIHSYHGLLAYKYSSSLVVSRTDLESIFSASLHITQAAAFLRNGARRQAARPPRRQAARPPRRRRSSHRRHGRARECSPECARRCGNTQYKKPCLFFCNKCCSTCLCVPSGYYGNKGECPCYNNWKTKRGGPSAHE